MDRNQLVISWSTIDYLVDKLYNQLKDKQFIGIYGLPRGGLIPAVMLSHKLNIPLLIKIDHLNCANPSEILVIDEIVDSGKSMSIYQEIGYTTACLNLRYSSSLVPDHVGKIINTDDRIVYPWEVNSSMTNGIIEPIERDIHHNTE